MSQENKLISIIIPTYNRAVSLRNSLPSYLAQEFTKEIIIVNDGSNDNTEEIIKEFMNKHPIKYVRHRNRKGSAAARNTGVRQAKGNFILFGEDDICFEENYSVQLLNCLRKTGADIISGRIIYMKDREGRKEALKRADSYSGPLLNKRLLYLSAWKKLSQDKKMPFTHGCMLVQAKIFNQCKFDEKYSGNGWRDETDFQLAAAKLGYKIYLCPHTVCFHLPRDMKDKGGQWSMNMLSFSWWAIKNNRYFLNKHYDFLKNSMDIPYSKSQLIFFAFLNRFYFFLKSLFK